MTGAERHTQGLCELSAWGQGGLTPASSSSPVLRTVPSLKGHLFKDLFLIMCTCTHLSAVFSESEKRSGFPGAELQALWATQEPNSGKQTFLTVKGHLQPCKGR